MMESDMCNSLVDCPASVSNKRSYEDGESMPSNDVPEGFETTNNVEKGSSIINSSSSLPCESTLPDSIEPRLSKHQIESKEPNIENKRSRIVTLDSDNEAQMKDSVSKRVKLEDQSDLKENTVDSVADSLPSQNGTEKFHCTACNKMTVDVHSHPLLKVIICADCRSVLQEKMQVKVLFDIFIYCFML